MIKHRQSLLVSDLSEFQLLHSFRKAWDNVDTLHSYLPNEPLVRVIMGIWCINLFWSRCHYSECQINHSARFYVNLPLPKLEKLTAPNFRLKKDGVADESSLSNALAPLLFSPFYSMSQHQPAPKMLLSYDTNYGRKLATTAEPLIWWHQWRGMKNCKLRAISN